MLENPASDGIDVADSNAVYYYHFDGLGSVVALSDSDGDTVQAYEYSVYGKVAAKARSDVLNLSRWYDIISAVQWRKELAYGLSDSELGRLRLNTHTGRCLGRDRFLSMLEMLLSRMVRPLPVVHRHK